MGLAANSIDWPVEGNEGVRERVHREVGDDRLVGREKGLLGRGEGRF